MIGTTLKVGMDTSAVSRGLGRISRGFGRFGRQVGIGAARQVGARATDMLGRVVMAMPRAIKDTSAYVSNLTDMATQTGVGVNQLIELEEMFRLAGVNARDTSKAVSQLADSLYRARTEGGPTKDALNQLGFSAQQFKDLNIHESYFKIAEQISAMGENTDGVETAMKDLFGMREGAQMLRLFKDLDANMIQAASNVQPFTSMFSKNGDLAYDIDRFADAMGRFETVKRSFTTKLLESAFTSMGPDFMNEFFDWLQNSDFTAAISKTMEDVAKIFERLRSGESITKMLGEGISNLARMIGTGIAEGMQEALGGTRLGRLLGGGKSDGGGGVGGILTEGFSRVTKAAGDVKTAIIGQKPAFQ